MLGLSLSGEGLGEFGSLAEPLTFEVENVDWDSTDRSEDSEDGRRPLKVKSVVRASDVFVDC
jgi:hypothetical protein